MNCVLIEGLKLEASIGVFDWEKEISQILVFDLKLETDFKKAASSDDINEAIDYVKVCDLISSIIKSRHFNLLETLADNVADKILNDFPVLKLNLSVMKPGAVPEAKAVGVSLERVKV